MLTSEMKYKAGTLILCDEEETLVLGWISDIEPITRKYFLCWSDTDMYNCWCSEYDTEEYVLMMKSYLRK